MEKSASNLILLIIIILTFIWMLLFTFSPSMVKYVNKDEVIPDDNATSDPAKCFVGSLIITVLIIIIIWMFKSCY